MAETTSIPAKLRNDTGTRAARKLRQSGEIPAIMYGHHQESVALSVEAESIEALIRHGVHGLLEVDVAGKKESAIIKEMQWDAFGREVLHVDFARVHRDEKVLVETPITLRGTAPGVSEENGVLNQQLHTIELLCPASKIEDEVVVNINELHLNDAVLVKDLELSPGVEPTAEPEQVVVSIVERAEEVEPEESAEVAAEPELIRREDEQEEGEESSS